MATLLVATNRAADAEAYLKTIAEASDRARPQAAAGRLLRGAAADEAATDAAASGWHHVPTAVPATLRLASIRFALGQRATGLRGRRKGARERAGQRAALLLKGIPGGAERPRPGGAQFRAAPQVRSPADPGSLRARPRAGGPGRQRGGGEVLPGSAPLIRKRAGPFAAGATHPDARRCRGIAAYSDSAERRAEQPDRAVLLARA